MSRPGGHDHAGDEHLFVIARLHLLERGADAEERLARARLAIDGDERDRRIVERIEQEALAEIGGLEGAAAADGDVIVAQLAKFAVAEVPRGHAVAWALLHCAAARIDSAEASRSSGSEMRSWLAKACSVWPGISMASYSSAPLRRWVRRMSLSSTRSVR